MNQHGRVFIVGAGPGDADLITVKGMKRIQHADVLVYDRLANPALLEYAQPWTEHIYVGKEPQHHRLDQSEINTLLIDKAQQGKNVVRLKGGDPFVFGRGGEECHALARAGVSFEIVPGVSSAIAAPAYAGIPVTHRHVAQSFTVVTGHTCQDDDVVGADWDDLPIKGTLIILMGVRHLPQIAERLITNGRDPSTPAATIHRASTPEQKVVVGTLADIATKAHGIEPPAITVIGDVVNLRRYVAWVNPTPVAAESLSIAA